MKIRKQTAALTAMAAMMATSFSSFGATFDENGISGPGELPITEEQSELDVFIVQLASVGELTENSVTVELEEATNVKLNMTMVPEEGAQEKLNLMMAGGDYPDVIIGHNIFSNEDMIKYGTEEQMLIPLNDLIEKYGVNMKARFAEHPNWKEEMTMPDGNIYGIPSADSGGSGHGDCAYKLWINTQWLDNLGLEMPTTTDEFKAVLQAFKNDDPNGNGKADEIPLTGATGTWAAEPYLNLLNAFGYFNQQYYYFKDGEIQTILDQDYLREGLAYLNDLYTEGLIDLAAFTQDESQMSAIGNNEGEVIAGAATCGHVGMFVNINNPERYAQYEIMMPLTGPNGYRGIPYTLSASVSSASFAITDVCEHPEIAMKLADLFCGEEWSVRGQVGIKGVEWDDADANTFGMDGETEAKYQYLKFATVSSAAATEDYWDWTLRLLEPNWKNLFEVEGDILDPTNYEARLYQDTVKLKDYAADVDILSPLVFEGEDSVSFAQLSTAVSDYASNAIVEFITGKRNIETDWDSYLADLSRLGYQDMIDLVKKAYEK